MNKVMLYTVVLKQKYPQTQEYNGRYTTVMTQIESGDGNQPAVYADYAEAQAYKNLMQGLYPDEVYEVLTSAVNPGVTTLTEHYPKDPEKARDGSLTGG